MAATGPISVKKDLGALVLAVVLLLLFLLTLPLVGAGQGSLEIDKTAGPEPAQAGGTIAYTIKVTNGTNSALDNLLVTDTVPANTTYISGSMSAPEGATRIQPTSMAAGEPMTWTIGSLKQHSSIAMTFEVMANSPLISGTTIANTAWVSEASSRLSATATSTAYGTPRLAVAKTVSPAAVQPNGAVTYTLVVTNSGNGIAQGVTVTDTLSAGFAPGQEVWARQAVTEVLSLTLTATAPVTDGTYANWVTVTWGVSEAHTGATAPVLVDGTPPDDPTNVQSTTHTTSTWSNDNIVTVTWTDAVDTGSGLDGYSALWSQSAAETPDDVKDIEEGVETATSGPLADGNGWYFHLRAVDNLGNWVNTVHLGPFEIDATPPIPSNPAISEASDYLHAVGLTLYYGHDMASDQVFRLQGQAGDTPSGLDEATFTVAFGEGPFTDAEPTDWLSGDYTVRGADTGDGVITVTITDNAGNAAQVFFPYLEDADAPTSAVTDVPTCTSQSPISVTWSAGDGAGSGVKETCLYVRYKGGIFTNTLDCQAGASGTFDYTPDQGDGTYDFQTVATDNVANVEGVGDAEASTLFDTMAATIVYTYPSAGGDTDWYRTDPDAVVDVDFHSDGDSGLDILQYRVEGGAWQEIANYKCWPSSSQTYDHTANWPVLWSLLGQGANEVDIRVYKCSGELTTHLYEQGVSGFRFLKDTVVPTGPTNLGSSHTPYNWSKDNTIEVTWPAAVDPVPGSGLDGYSVDWSQSATTVPDQVKDIEEGVQAATSGPLADGSNWYFHIRAVDIAGNWGNTVHLGPFYIDTTPPGDPGNVHSTSHTPSTWSNDNTVTVVWNDAADAGSGLDGYSVEWSQSATTLPNTTIDVQEDEETFTSAPLADANNWWFHIRAVDNVGNWVSTVHLGPFYIDTLDPTSTASAPLNFWPPGGDIEVTWTATDTASGPVTTCLHSRFEGGTWTKGACQAGTSGTFPFTTGTKAGTYCFQTIATDLAGNVEDGPAGDGDACTTLRRHRVYLPLVFWGYVPPAPDLSTSTKTADRDEVGAGEELEYTIVLRNTGNADAESVILADDIPGQTTFDAIVEGCTYNAESIPSRVEWSGPLAAGGGTHTCKFRVQVGPGASRTIVNTATADDGHSPVTLQTSTRVLSWHPGGLAGYLVYSLAVCPTDCGIVYAGTEANGVFKSVDGGKSWSATGMKTGMVRGIAVDPGNCLTAYATTWGSGILKTVNGGVSWQARNTGLGEMYLYALAIDPGDARVVYAGTSIKGVYKSTDGADHWTQAGLDGKTVAALVIDRTPPTPTIYAGTWGAGIYKSPIAVNSWTEANVGLGDLEVYALAIDPTNTDRLYAATFTDGVYGSVNRGDSWTKEWPPAADRVAYNIAVDKYGLAYVGTDGAGDGKGMYRRPVAGPPWQAMPTQPGTAPVVRSIVASPSFCASDLLLAGTKDGVWWYGPD